MLIIIEINTCKCPVVGCLYRYKGHITQPPTNTDSSVVIRILKLITDEKLTIDVRGTQKILLTSNKGGVVR